MSFRFTHRIYIHAFGAILIAALWTPAAAHSAASSDTAQSNWQVPARWRHGLLSKTPGTLMITDTGVDFRPEKGELLSWKFEEIQTFRVSPHRLELTGYQNRRWHFHGERSFRFDFAAVLPPAVAATLAARVGKPAINGVPNPSAPAFATLGARDRTRGGGTNGTLRANYSGAPIAIADPTVQEYFDAAAFSVPAPGTFGNAGRNTIRGPGTTDVDMSLGKDIVLDSSGRALSLRVEAANVFNLPQFSVIDTVVNSPTFGRVIAARPMRSVQVVTRFRF